MSNALQGLMQDDFPLTLHHIRRRMRSCSPGAQVTTLTPSGDVERATFGEVAERIDRLARALSRLGVEKGDRVGTFAWNNQRHFELYFAIPCVGAVLHTLNIRLFEEQLTYIVNHAEDRVIFVDDSLVPVLEKLAPELPDGRAVCRDGRRRHGRAAQRGPLRGAAGGRRSRRLRLSRRGRATGGGALLHERHDGQPEGCPLLASLDQPALDGHADEGLDRPVGERSRACGRADVPRQRVGATPRRRARRRRPDPARPVPRRRAAGEADRLGATHADGLRADDLPRSAALCRWAPRRRPVLPQQRCMRWLGRAEAADEGFRRAPRRPHLPGVGHDRDESRRHLLAPAGGRARRRLLGRPRQAGTAAAVG